MIAAVVLVLTVMQADRSLATAAYPMPSVAVCERAAREFVAGEPFEGSAVRIPTTAGTRAAACVTVDARGKDT